MIVPTSVVPGSIMPAYKHMFSSNADIETAYAEALTVKKSLMSLMMWKGQTKLGTWEEAKEEVKAQAGEIVEQMKNQRLKMLLLGEKSKKLLL